MRDQSSPGFRLATRAETLAVKRAIHETRLAHAMERGDRDVADTARRELDRIARWESDTDYAETDEAGQLSLGVAGEQRAIPGLAAPRKEGEAS